MYLLTSFTVSPQHNSELCRPVDIQIPGHGFFFYVSSLSTSHCMVISAGHTGFIDIIIAIWCVI